MQPLLTCPNHYHPISYICFDPACITAFSQIMCNQCAQAHNTKFNHHRVLEFHMLKHYVDTFSKEIEYQEIREIIRDEFLILKADVVKRLNDFEDSVMASISMELSDHHEFQVFQGEVALLAKNQLFNKYLLNISSLPLLKEQIKFSNIHILKQIRSLNEDLTKIFQTHQKQISLPQIFKPFLFSNLNKHQNIELIENGTMIKCTGNQAHIDPFFSEGAIGHSQLALCKQPFTPMNTKVDFLIKQMSTRNCITIGGCLLSHVKKNKFLKCWQMGNGTYSLFINTFGTVKSNHHSNKLHSDRKIKNWKLMKGDRISVEIDFMKQRIVFVRNGKDELSMPVDIGEEKLYPFVALSYTKDYVQLI